MKEVKFQTSESTVLRKKSLLHVSGRGTVPGLGRACLPVPQVSPMCLHASRSLSIHYTKHEADT